MGQPQGLSLEPDSPLSWQLEGPEVMVAPGEALSPYSAVRRHLAALFPGTPCERNRGWRDTAPDLEAEMGGGKDQQILKDELVRRPHHQGHRAEEQGAEMCVHGRETDARAETHRKRQKETKRDRDRYTEKGRGIKTHRKRLRDRQKMTDIKAGQAAPRAHRTHGMDTLC